MSLTNEDLQAIANLLQPIKDDVQSIKEEQSQLKSDLNQTERVLKNEIRKESALVLDEVERVHDILDKHKADTTKHTA